MSFHQDTVPCMKDVTGTKPVRSSAASAVGIKSILVPLDDEQVLAASRQKQEGMAKVADAPRSMVDLIVIATHRYTGSKHALLGSTTEPVVRHLRCPVLVVGQREDAQRTTRNTQPQGLT